jgi:hypothetical protein
MDDFRNVSLNLNFTLEQEQKNTLNFLNITINRDTAESEWQFRFYTHRKPTTTHCIVPYGSCHPVDHRLASIRFLSIRLCTYALFPQDKEIETQFISTINCNNHFNLNILDQVDYKSNKHSIQEDGRMNKKITNNNKWISFSYVGK